MVFFTCNACGSSVKKNQVEKHYQIECRSCSVLSCMDCGQDFYGDDYASHTQCISEAQKYQGSMFKGTGNKGDKKQQDWLEKARMAMQSAKVKPKLKALLEKVSEYPNIPRKKSKFENFVRNSCQVRDPRTLDELWEVFNQAAQPVACATSMNTVDSQEGEKLEKEVMTQETGHALGNNEGLTKKKNKIQVEELSETEMKEEVECHGPVKKKTKKRTVEEEVDCHGPVKKRKKQTEMRTVGEDMDDGPSKKKTEMRKVEKEQENMANERKKKRKKEASTITESDEKKLLDQEKMKGLGSVDEGRQVVVSSKERKRKSEGSKSRKLEGCQTEVAVAHSKKSKIKH